MKAVVVTDRFRQLVAGLTDQQGFEALMFHIRCSNSEGICPVCAGDLEANPTTDRECQYSPKCIHGRCAGCEHSSHYDQTQEPDVASLPDEAIRSTKAVLDEMIVLLDAGHHVSMRPI